MPERSVNHDSAVGRQSLKLLVSTAYLLPLVRVELIPIFHALESALALLGWQAIEFAQPFLEFCLTLRGQALEVGIIFQGFFLLVRREVFVGPEPIAQSAWTFRVILLLLSTRGIASVCRTLTGNGNGQQAR